MYPALAGWVLILALSITGALRGFFFLSTAVFFAYSLFMYLPFYTARNKIQHFPRKTSQFIPPFVPFIEKLPFHSYWAPIKRPELRAFIDEQFEKDGGDSELVAFASHSGPAVYTRNVDHIKEITVTNPWDFPKASHLYGILGVFGENIVTAHDGPVHKKHRSICNPAFSMANLEYTAEVASDQLSSLFGLWEGEGKGGKEEEYFIDPEKGLFNLTLSIISEAGFGKKFGLARLEEMGEEGEGEMSFEEAMHVVSEKLGIKLVVPDLAYNLPIPSLKRVGKAFEKFENTLKEVMESSKSNSSKKDLISLLIRANEKEGDSTSKRKLSPTEIYGDIFMFLFAGHETSAGVLGWTLRFLATNPIVQEKAYQEVKGLFEEREEEGLRITAKEADQKLIYCRCVFYETMRCHPVVQAVPKFSAKDTTLGGEVVKKGTIVNIDIKGVHMNPKYWENPTEFEPERFDRRVNEPINPHSFVPFSFGQRNCIGQKFSTLESTIAIARLVHRYKFSLPEGVTQEELWEEKSILTTKCANPVKLRFKLRE